MSDERELQRMVKAATERYNALSPVDRAVHDLMQRRSGVRGLAKMSTPNEVIDAHLDKQPEFVVLKAYREAQVEITRLTSALAFSEQAYADMQADRDWWKRRCEELRAECDRYAAIMGQRITRDVSFDGVTIKKGCAVSTLIIAATRTLDMGLGDLDEQ